MLGELISIFYKRVQKLLKILPCLFNFCVCTYLLQKVFKKEYKFNLFYKTFCMCFYY